MTTLLIGGAGYIGSVLTAHLLQRGHRVRVLDNMMHGQNSVVGRFADHRGYSFHHGDAAERGDIRRALDGVSEVVVLAGIVGDPAVKANLALAERINEKAMRAMPKWLNGAGLRRVVFISSCSVYGLYDGIAGEDAPLNPLSEYAIQKRDAEYAFLSASVDFRPVVLRLGTALGLSPRMRWDLTVNEFARAGRDGSPLTVYDAVTARPYVHVTDIARAVECVLSVSDLPRPIFNVVGENASKAEIVSHVQRMAPGLDVIYTANGADRRDYRASGAALESLGFAPRVTVAQGIAEIVGGGTTTRMVAA